MTTLFVGVDIAAQTAAVHWQDQNAEQSGTCEINQNLMGYRLLHQHLSRFAATSETHVVMEATGNYWLKLTLFLHEHGYTVSVLNPIQSKRFAQVQLQRTKTDALDARVLSDYARTLQPDPWTPPPAIYYKLRHALERRDDLLKMATQESNRLHALQHDPHVPKDILTQIRRHIATLKRQAQAYLKQIEHLLTDHSEWHPAAERLLSIPGIGPLTTAWTLVITHAFTRCETPQQAAALAGVVPHHRRSGTSLNGRSHIGGGHPKWRKALYMAAGACIQFNPPLKAFFDKKVAQGKTKQIARIAVARKLVHIAWACVTKDRDFDPDYQRSIQAV